MADLRRERNDFPSLFPVFNVLVCLLGALILIMGAVSVFSLGPGRSVRIDVEGRTPASKVPVYLEWNGTQLVAHPSREAVAIDIERVKISEADLPRAKRMAKSSSFEKVWQALWQINDGRLLEQIAGTGLERTLKRVREKRDREYVVVLVRPSGFDSFLKLRNVLIRQQIDVGYEPVDQKWKVAVK